MNTRFVYVFKKQRLEEVASFIRETSFFLYGNRVIDRERERGQRFYPMLDVARMLIITNCLHVLDRHLRRAASELFASFVANSLAGPAAVVLLEALRKESCNCCAYSDRGEAAATC